MPRPGSSLREGDPTEITCLGFSLIAAPPNGERLYRERHYVGALTVRVRWRSEIAERTGVTSDLALDAPQPIGLGCAAC